MILTNEELQTISGGSLKEALIVGIGSVISFFVGVFESFFARC